MNKKTKDLIRYAICITIIGFSNYYFFPTFFFYFFYYLTPSENLSLFLYPFFYLIIISSQCFLFFSFRYKKLVLHINTFNWEIKRSAFTILFIYISFVIISTYIQNLFPFLNTSDFNSKKVNQNGILYLVMSILIGPFFEEILMRGILYKKLRVYFNSFISIILTSICFSLYHTNPAKYYSAFCAGIILAYIYEKTGSLSYCILFHCINNLFVTINRGIELKIFSSDVFNINEVLCHLTLLLALPTLIYFLKLLKPVMSEIETKKIDRGTY